MIPLSRRIYLMLALALLVQGAAAMPPCGDGPLATGYHAEGEMAHHHNHGQHSAATPDCGHECQHCTPSAPLAPSLAPAPVSPVAGIAPATLPFRSRAPDPLLRPPISA